LVPATICFVVLFTKWTKRKWWALVKYVGDALRTEVSSRIAKLDEKRSALADTRAKSTRFFALTTSPASRR
jgi:hypothetical protein